MRFLNVILSVNPREGGTVEALRQQARALCALGHISDVACMDLADDDWIEGQPFKVYALGDLEGARRRDSVLPWRRYGRAPQLKPWLAEQAGGYDAVIVHGLWNYTAYAAWAALRGGTVPYFVFPHGMMAAWFRRNYPVKHWVKQAYWLLSEGRLLRDADCVLFTSTVEQEEAETAFLGHRFTGRVIPLGISEPPLLPDGGDTFRQSTPQLGARPYLLFLSRIHEKKGLDILLDAFAAAAPAGLDLVVAGPDDDGLTPVLKAQAERLGIAGRVHWPGMLSGDAKWSALRGARALVLASHQENFGVVVAEAMACALPVLTTDKVALWRDIEAAQCGLIGSDTRESFTAVLARFLGLPPEERAAMGRRGREAFLEKFEAGNAAKALVSLASEFARP